MPALTFNQGLLMLLYYDSHLDHTMGYFTPRPDLSPDPSGRFYKEERAPLGELSRLADPAVFTPFIDDANLSIRRHTIDVRVGQATAGLTPSFSSVPVSNFLFGQRGDETKDLKTHRFGDAAGTTTLQVTDPSTFKALPQLQFNPPNLPIFAKATAAFIGDYIDIAGQTFTIKNGSWAFNTDPSTSAFHYAVWTSNQDVRPPVPNADGTYDWSKYTPPNSAITALSPTSTFDPTQLRPVCNPDNEGNQGTRNQNIYGARISCGLAVSSPQNVKPLSSSFVRAFVVAATNTTSSDLPFRFSFAAPTGVLASFVNDFSDRAKLTPSIDVMVPAHSSVQRSLFVLLASANGLTAATIPVHVDQIDTSSPANCHLADATNLCNVRGDPAALRGSLTLNPPGSDPGLVQPDGTVDPIAEGEVYDPLLSASYYQDPKASNLINTNFINSNLVNSNLINSNFINSNLINSTYVSAAHVSSALASNFVNSNLVNSNLINSNFVNSNFVNSNLINSNFINSNLVNSNLINSNFINATLSDTSYVATNTGNTTHSYHVRLVGKVPKDMPPHALQLIVSKNYTTPLALGCQLVEESHPAVVATVGNPTIQSPSAFIADPNKPNITDPSTTNATLSLAPGESAVITLRGLVDGDDASGTLLKQITSHLSAVVVAHAGGYSSGFLITSDDSNMPRATVGQPYGPVALKSEGGRGGNTWSFPADGIAPPSWLKWVNDKAGSMGTVLAAYPDAPGTFMFTVRVTDSTGAFAERELTLVVKPATTMVLSSSSNPSTRGQAVTFTATLTSSGGSPDGSVTFRENGTAIGTGTLSGGVTTATTPSLTLGSHDVVATYAGNDAFGSASATVQQTVRAGTTTTLVSDANPSVFGQPVTFTATVSAVGSGTGNPSGTVTFKDGGTPIGTGQLAGNGVATFTTSSLALGKHFIVASYPGDAGNFSPSESSPALSQIVNQANTSTSLVSNANPSVFGQQVTFTATVTAVGPGAGTPTGTVTFKDGGTPIGTGTLSGGTGTFSTSSLSVATHDVTASYDGNGDGNFAASQPLMAVSQIVNKAGITVAAPATGHNPSVYGQSVTLSTTVSATRPGAGTPTGKVTFTVNDLAIGAPVTLAGGPVSLTTTSLPVGANQIAADYAGDDNFTSGTFRYVVHTVNQAGTTIDAPSVSPGSPVFGESVLLSTTVHAADPGSGTPTGTVTFKDGGGPIGTGTLSGGVATLTTSALAAGAHSFTASYGGDTNFLGGTDSASWKQDIGRSATSVATPTSSLSPTVFGQPVTFTVAVSAVAPGAGTPTGTVTFKDGVGPIGTGMLSGGVATLTTSALAAAVHEISASYAGNGSFTGSSGSSPLSQVVNPATTAAALVSDANPSVFGQPVTFTATMRTVAPGAGTPTGTVTFTDGSATMGTVGLDASGVATWTASSLITGAHAIVATYAPSAGSNFVGSASSLAQAVDLAPTWITMSVSPGSSTYGQPVTFTATVASGIGTPSGSVTFTDGGNAIGSRSLAGGVATFTFAGLSAGSHAIAAAYQGAGNFGSSAGALHPAYPVAQASTTTSVASSANPSSSPSVMLTATVSAVAPGAGIPTGTVTFKDGATSLGVAALDAQGVATLPTSLAAGARTILAFYGGDANFIGSDSAPYAQTVKATTTTTLASSSNPSTYGQSVTFTARVNASFGTATGTVTFTDGAAPLGSASLNASGVATWTASSLVTGAHAIVATYAPLAGSNFVGSTSAPLTQNVNGYGFIGFLTPLKTAGSFQLPKDSGVQKIGSAIPVKWQLTDGTGAFISDLGTALSVSVYKFTCGAWTLPDVNKPTYIPYDSVGGAKGNSTFRYGSNTFIFNWDTGAGSGVVTGCYEVVLALKDGTRKATNIQLK